MCLSLLLNTFFLYIFVWYFSFGIIGVVYAKIISNAANLLFLLAYQTYFLANDHIVKKIISVKTNSETYSKSELWN